jgi:hypothetical protein
MMHTNMQIVVVIEHVETIILIFEEDIHDDYPNASKSKRLPQ